jgi:hypothetical protein
MPKKPRRHRKKKPQINVDQLTEEQIREIKFKDLIGTASRQELEALRKLNIGSFMLHTVDTSGFFPKDLDPKVRQYHEKMAEKWRKKKKK